MESIDAAAYETTRVKLLLGVATLEGNTSVLEVTYPPELSAEEARASLEAQIREATLQDTFVEVDILSEGIEATLFINTKGLISLNVYTEEDNA